MKPLTPLLAALLLAAGPALAQTGNPRATVPGTHPVVTPDMRNAGSPRASRHDAQVPGMSHRDEKRLRKLGKVKHGTVKPGKS